MTKEELDQAYSILGPKIVMSIRRRFEKQDDLFKQKIIEMVEDNKNNFDVWYKKPV